MEEPGLMSDEVYTAKTLMDFLGISRSTLRYYEQIGIVRPKRDDQSNYRTFDLDDIYRVVGSYMLKNAGYAVQDAQVVLDRPDTARGLVRSLAEENERHRSWHEAMGEALKRVERVCDEAEADESEPRLVQADTWLCYYDRGETSYENFDPTSAMAVLLRSIPIATFGAVFDGDFLASESVPYRSFRAIPRRLVGLLPELREADQEPEPMGGCPCVAVASKMRFDEIRLLLSGHGAKGALAAFIEREGFAVAGPAFSVNAWPVRDAIYAELYVPVRAASLRARRAFKRLDCARL